MARAAPKKKRATKGTPTAVAPPEETVLVLRTCAADMTSYGGFRWPESGIVEATDWNPTPVCGYGLHGLLWGEGNGSLISWNNDARWLVVEVPAASVVDLGGKVKFPRGSVVYCGDRLTATSLIAARRPGAIVGGTATAGDHGTATAGDRGTATAGYGGTATAGYGGTATAGDHGTATAGDRGTATAGDRGTLSMRWWDGTRYRIAVFYVGDDGIEAGVPYRCDGGKAVKVETNKSEAA